ncbi:amidase family protein [Flavisphingomonas formosensis]|uniref:amidase family protein n=1 Tax=Flavisphingomonas formosensis TaxID=861534 RepID=UPI0012F849FC|nr:amidase family protein [Sphingomonas formosensis]
MDSAAAWELGSLDAHAQIELVDKGDISRAELTASAITRCEDADPLLNALSLAAFDYSRDRAKRLPNESRFAGLPYLLKDSLDYPGLPSRCASRATSSTPRERGFAFVEQLDAEGLIPIGKSNMPEFALMAVTEPVANGITRNPRHPGYSCGGSSGGAAAAVAAGLVPFAHGSDGGGSIRIPASCCGLIGYKPGRGFNLRARGPHIVEDLIVGDALMARSARDTAWAARLLRPPSAKPCAVPRDRPLRIAMVEATLEGRQPHPDVAEAVRHTARLLEAMGHHIEAAEWPSAFGDVIEAFLSMWAYLAREAALSVIDPRSEQADALLEPWTLGLARSVNDDPAALEHFYRSVADAAGAVGTFFGAYDLLLCPTVSSPPPPVAQLAPTRPYATLRREMFDFVAYTPLQNLTGLPSVSVPTFRNSDGLPIGSMLTAPRGGDDLLLRLVADLENAGAWSTAIARPAASDPQWAALSGSGSDARG